MRTPVPGSRSIAKRCDDAGQRPAGLSVSEGRAIRGMRIASKPDVRIIDFAATEHPALLRMWDKCQRGYRAMGYRVGSDVPAE